MLAKNFPNLKRDMDIQVDKANRSPYYLNAKRPCPRHIIMKLSKIKDKKIMLKTVREKRL